jgi:hypothetical protein
MSFVNWVLDSIAGDDYLDLHFVVSDLVDINITEAEICEIAHFDSMASFSAREFNGDGKTPTGKQVL